MFWHQIERTENVKMRLRVAGLLNKEGKLKKRPLVCGCTPGEFLCPEAERLWKLTGAAHELRMSLPRDEAHEEQRAEADQKYNEANAAYMKHKQGR